MSKIRKKKFDRSGLRHEITSYVRDDFKRTQSVPSEHKICQKFGISLPQLYRVFFISKYAELEGRRNLFREMGIGPLSPEAIEAVARDMRGEFRPQILKRDNNECIACGGRDRLELAHILSCNVLRRTKTEGPPCTNKAQVKELISRYYVPENLLTLCKSCHMLFDLREQQGALWLADKTLGKDKGFIGEAYSGAYAREPTDQRRKIEEIQEKIRERMYSLYGRDWFKVLCGAMRIPWHALDRKALMCKLGIGRVPT